MDSISILIHTGYRNGMKDNEQSGLECALLF